ncbi:MAG: hypothetical protein MK211_02035 [Flavobacteriales bacterium]|nr:hypothetical protein [Flavobacteriales bacterium]
MILFYLPAYELSYYLQNPTKNNGLQLAQASFLSNINVKILKNSPITETILVYLSHHIGVLKGLTAENIPIELLSDNPDKEIMMTKRI